jgi:hypothetical protein
VSESFDGDIDFVCIGVAVLGKGKHGLFSFFPSLFLKQEVKKDRKRGSSG